MSDFKQPILIHACCGVCFSYPMVLLREMNFEPVVYYFNSNIYPESEFERRYEELKRYCEYNSIKLIKAHYNHLEFLDFIRGLENEPERGARCQKCFYYRLIATLRMAVELKINKITTTLSISPHKISKDIFAAAKKALYDIKNENSLINNLEFMEFDFKKKDGFKKTSKIAYEFGMYRQNYCGCEYSVMKQT